MKVAISQLLLSLFLSSIASTHGAGEGDFYTYYESGGLGPSRWQFLQLSAGNNQCGGTAGASGFGQSPVTVSAATAANCDTDTETKYDFTAGRCTFDDLEFKMANNGVIVQPSNDCLFGRMEIPHTDTTFKALQFHIHTYSEHEIVGQGPGQGGFWPAELHVVHQEEVDTPSFAVFGTMMERGDEDHPVFEWFLRGWEKKAREVAAACPAPEGEPSFVPRQNVVQCQAPNTFPDWGYDVNEAAPLDFIDLYRQLPTVDTETELGFYTYKGGLTTPACTEAVNWNLADQAMKISSQQMDRLQYLILCHVAVLEDGTCEHATVASETGSTSRPPQPLEGRQVLHRCPDGPRVTIDDIGTLPDESGPFEKPEPVEEPANTKSGKCEKKWFEDCSEDKRYDPRASPNLKANAPVWEDMQGYWVGKMHKYDQSGEPMAEVFDSDIFTNTLPYPQDEVEVFVNLTVVETRLYRHVYYVYKAASQEFCSNIPPPGARNVLGAAGVCGSTGYAMAGSKFAAATHEKDGVAKIFAGQGRFAGEGAESGEFAPVDEDTIYSVVRADSYEESETITFTNADKTRVSGSGQYFVISEFPPYSTNPLAESFTYELSQVSMETFVKELDDAQNDNNVPTADMVMKIRSGDCTSEEGCPSMDDWKMVDPLHTSSPYDEDAKWKGGFIALLVILLVIILVGTLVYIHHMQVAKQADRYKHQFARRIAQTIEMEGTHDKLTPEALEAEFKKMDNDNDGVLAKSELKDFMGDKMSDRDFDAMFAAIDLDHNGTLDFAEFCAFMAQIGAVYDEEQVQNA